MRHLFPPHPHRSRVTMLAWDASSVDCGYPCACYLLAQMSIALVLNVHTSLDGLACRLRLRLRRQCHHKSYHVSTATSSVAVMFPPPSLSSQFSLQLPGPPSLLNAMELPAADEASERGSSCIFCLRSSLSLSRLLPARSLTLSCR